MKYFAMAALSALCLAAPASAFDGVTYRVEAHGGWDRVTVGGGGDDGLMYGIGLGVDVPLGSMAFIGFEVGGDLSSTKDCISDIAMIGDSYCRKAKRDLSAVGRIGADIGGGIKIYALGGYTNARITERYDNSAGVTLISGSANGDGWRAGAGAEVKLSKSVYTKLEYRFSKYEGGYKRHQVVTGLGVGL